MNRWIIALVLLVPTGALVFGIYGSKQKQSTAQAEDVPKEFEYWNIQEDTDPFNKTYSCGVFGVDGSSFAIADERNVLVFFPMHRLVSAAQRYKNDIFKIRQDQYQSCIQHGQDFCWEDKDEYEDITIEVVFADGKHDRHQGNANLNLDRIDYASISVLPLSNDKIDFNYRVLYPADAKETGRQIEVFRSTGTIYNALEAFEKVAECKKRESDHGINPLSKIEIISPGGSHTGSSENIDQ